ncbi:MAG: YihY/virulence factor BrkB family protein [Bacteroidales bacterium]|nr:YihY/virulence factor BrkB family protein [Bacteroidales bacterium]
MNTSNKLKILETKPVKHALEFSQSHSMPGFGGIPIYDVFDFFIKSIIKGAIAVRASSVAFNFFLGIFPAIIFFFTLIPYIPIDNFQYELLRLIKDITPDFAYETISSTITDIATNKRGSLLSFGFISALYFSTKGINSLIAAFNATSLDYEHRKWLNQQVISVFLMLVVVMLLSVAIFLITITGPVLDYLVGMNLMTKDIVYYLVIFAKWIVVIALFLFIFSSMYYYAPASKTDWRFFSPGSMFATALSILISYGFAFYVSNFGQYNKLYGSLGTLIVILMWLYLNAFIIILGFELNVSIKNAKFRKSLE